MRFTDPVVLIPFPEGWTPPKSPQGSTEATPGIVMIFVRQFKEGERSAYTKEISPGWIVDFDDKNKPICFEILNPSKHFPQKILDLLPNEFGEE